MKNLKEFIFSGVLMTIWKALLAALVIIGLFRALPLNAAPTTNIFRNIVPETANTYNLGSFTKTWAGFYASGTIYANGFVGNTATSTFANGLQLSGGCFLDASGACLTSGGGGANTALSNLVGVAINTSLVSDANNTDDLGAYGLAWKNIYASGTIFANSYGGSSGTSTFNNGLAASALSITGAATSTVIVNGASVGSLNVSGATSSTFSNGIQLNTGCFLDMTGACLVNGANNSLSNLSALAINTSLLPATNNSLDLGGWGTAWRNLYASSSVRVGDGATSSTLSSSGNLTLTGLVLGGSGSGSAPTYSFLSDSATGMYLNTTSQIGFAAGGATFQLDATTWKPGANNSQDLGSIGQAWKDIFASGTLRIGGVGAGRIELGAAPFFWVNSSGGLGTSGTSYMAGIMSPTHNGSDLGSFSFAWKDIYASGTLRAGGMVLSGSGTSTIKGGLDLYGNLARGGINITTSSTFNLVFPHRAATGTPSVVKVLVPYDCNVGEITMHATSTPETSYPTVIDVNISDANNTSTSSLHSSQGTRPSLTSGAAHSSSTVPQTTLLTKGSILWAEIDQYGGHDGLSITAVCSRPLF